MSVDDRWNRGKSSGEVLPYLAFDILDVGVRKRRWYPLIQVKHGRHFPRGRVG